MRKIKTIKPVLTKKELRLIFKGLKILAGRNYELTGGNARILDDISLGVKEQIRLKDEANAAVELHCKLEQIVIQKGI